MLLVSSYIESVSQEAYVNCNLIFSHLKYLKILIHLSALLILSDAPLSYVTQLRPQK